MMSNTDFIEARTEVQMLSPESEEDETTFKGIMFDMLNHICSDEKRSPSSSSDCGCLIDDLPSSIDSSSDESECEEEDTIEIQEALPAVLKTVDEVTIEDLAPIESLSITADDDTCLELAGIVHSIVKTLVVIRGCCGPNVIDENTVLFSSDRRSLGVIFEIFGPVLQPFYTVRFNSEKDIENKDIKVDSEIFYAPYDNNLTKYVFPDELYQPGSDASWRNDNEPPENCMDFSDDEKEREFRKQLKRKHSTTNNNIVAPTNGKVSVSESAVAVVEPEQDTLLVKQQTYKTTVNATEQRKNTYYPKFKSNAYQHRNKVYNRPRFMHPITTTPLFPPSQAPPVSTFAHRSNLLLSPSLDSAKGSPYGIRRNSSSLQQLNHFSPCNNEQIRQHSVPAVSSSSLRHPLQSAENTTLSFSSSKNTQVRATVACPQISAQFTRPITSSNHTQIRTGTYPPRGALRFTLPPSCQNEVAHSVGQNFENRITLQNFNPILNENADRQNLQQYTQPPTRIFGNPTAAAQIPHQQECRPKLQGNVMEGFVSNHPTSKQNLCPSSTTQHTSLRPSLGNSSGPQPPPPPLLYNQMPPNQMNHTPPSVNDDHYKTHPPPLPTANSGHLRDGFNCPQMSPIIRMMKWPFDNSSNCVAANVRSTEMNPFSSSSSNATSIQMQPQHQQCCPPPSASNQQSNQQQFANNSRQGNVLRTPPQQVNAAATAPFNSNVQYRSADADQPHKPSAAFDNARLTLGMMAQTNFHLDAQHHPSHFNQNFTVGQSTRPFINRPYQTTNMHEQLLFEGRTEQGSAPFFPSGSFVGGAQNAAEIHEPHHHVNNTHPAHNHANNAFPFQNAPPPPVTSHAMMDPNNPLAFCFQQQHPPVTKW